MVGYPYYSYTDGGSTAVGRFRQTTYGVAAALPTIAMVNPGASASLRVQNQNGNVVVFLKTNSSAVITSKLSEVAAALTAYRDDQGQPSPILLGVSTDDTLSAGLTATALTGGFAPVLSQGLLRFDILAANGGLVYFDAKYPVMVEQLEILKSAGTPKIQIVTVDQGLNVITTEAIDITGSFTISSTTSYVYTGTPILLGPLEALYVTGITASTTNMIRAWARLLGASL
jgi:hypothetical protein